MRGDDLELAIADDGVGDNAKVDPRSTGMGQRIVGAMATKLEANVERDASLPKGNPDRPAVSPRHQSREGRQRRREVGLVRSPRLTGPSRPAILAS